MKDKSLSIWKITLGQPQKKNYKGFQFGETKMEFYKDNRDDELKSKITRWTNILNIERGI